MHRMQSDFRTARLTLTQALDSLQGSDPFSAQTREAVDLLIEAIAQTEFAKPQKSTNVIRFRDFQRAARTRR